MQYMCNTCGYMYDGEDFHTEPADYQCPLCDSHKDDFQLRNIDNEVCDATDEYHKKNKSCNHT